MTHELTTRDLTNDTWDDFVSALGSNGGARGCWCMHWRLSIAEWMEGKGEGNKRAMKNLSRRKPAPGVVVYDGATPVAWCSLGPRSAFARLDRSPLLKRVDDEQVCSVACVFVARGYRRTGLLPSILDAVCDYAAAHGYPPAVEGYPVDPPDAAAPVPTRR